MAKQLNPRAAAAKLAWQVIDHGQSLDAVLANYFEAQVDACSSDQNQENANHNRGFVQELVYGVCRWYGELNVLSTHLLSKPIRNKDRVVHFVLLVGLYQLRHLQTAEHAAVAETVSACKQLNKVWAKNLINGCLRSYLRSPIEPLENVNRVAHPEWISAAIESSWPSHAEKIFAANNQRPPMCLRVNGRQFSRDDYLEKLSQQEIDARADPFASDGVILNKACSVDQLPQFFDGACSVQDTAAQIAADLLAAQSGMSVLDACAAPGGKTAHLLERANNKLDMHALDISEHRIEQLHTSMQRLDLSANIIHADASTTPSWQLPESGYDRILIDAPCSGLGVIRRHPDIKHHRRESDIESLVQIQRDLLNNLWNTLKTGGRLLYMTCSILPAENELQMKQFVRNQNDAMLVAIKHPNALALELGSQTLTGVHNMDGFYYCLLEKTIET